MCEAEERILVQMTRLMQIIAGALMAGITSFFVIALVIQFDRPAGALPFVSYVAIGVFFLNAPLAAFLPAMLVRNKLRDLAARSNRTNNTEEENPTLVRNLLEARQAAMIIGRALLEGAAFLGLIAFLVEREPFVLVVPSLVLLIMLFAFPTVGRNRIWVGRQRELLENMARSDVTA